MSIRANQPWAATLDCLFVRWTDIKSVVAFWQSLKGWEIYFHLRGIRKQYVKLFVLGDCQLWHPPCNRQEVLPVAEQNFSNHGFTHITECAPVQRTIFWFCIKIYCNKELIHGEIISGVVKQDTEFHIAVWMHECTVCVNGYCRWRAGGMKMLVWTGECWFVLRSALRGQVLF